MRAFFSCEKSFYTSPPQILQRLYDAEWSTVSTLKHRLSLCLLWRWHAGASAQACLDSMTELVRYGQVAGKIRKDEPGLIAWSIWSAVHGFVQFETRLSMTSVDDDDAAYSFLLQLLIRGLSLT